MTSFHRRGMLWAIAGVLGGSRLARPQSQGRSAEARLKELGIELPQAPTPVAVYVPAVQVGELLLMSGTGPRLASGGYTQGKVGKDLTVEEGQAAARLVGLNVLAAVRAALGGNLDRVVRLARVHGMVNATPDFAEHPSVINGFSNLMVEVFGEEAGKGARSAVGMGSLPFNIPVEIESTWVVRS